VLAVVAPVAVFSTQCLGFSGLRFGALLAGLTGIGTVSLPKLPVLACPPFWACFLGVFTVSELSGIVLVCHYALLTTMSILFGPGRTVMSGPTKSPQALFLDEPAESLSHRRCR
jgi:hypothetical protein